jgi:murein DD-endopeptidase
MNRPGSVFLGILFGVLIGATGGFWVGRKVAETQPLPSAVPAAPVSNQQSAQEESIQTLEKVFSVLPFRPSFGPFAKPAEEKPASAPSVPENVRRMDISIAGSLYATLGKTLPGREADILNAQIGRILIWWMDVRRDVLPGDRVQALYESAPKPLEWHLLLVTYQNEQSAKKHRAYYFQSKGARYGRYYDEEGLEIEARLQDGPIQEYEQITELMNLSGRRHRGVDYKTDEGTPVVTPYRARVLRRNWKFRGNGNCLELLYLQSGVVALFMHLQEVLPAIQPGVVLEPGTVVAKTGNTGRSTAPHLHYELHGPGGNLLNPFKAQPTTRSKLEGDELRLFQEKRVLLDRWLQGDGGAS